ncbi:MULTISPECIES: SPFH domain-containing protein [Paenibacillus]|uniref:SPFH domain-containing protein n=1 Tax=Paenibacillus whitsoniae TaxID=2496558 RepID=A0A3S0A6C6_9BACL|nr:SPFH domain-containing protein [Paenibacillus whitsoniae]RTE00732.1 SPFH domain-containing protein [Paenibacillus whitsoniae]
MQEQKSFAMNGFFGILLIVVLAISAIFSFMNVHLFTGFIAILALLLVWSGLTVIQPNQTAVVTFFGRYLGTLRQSGFWFVVPLSSRKRVSIRVRNFNSVKLKVNDVAGNPIEIAAVVVFRVIDPAKAVFDVDSYEKFVEIQSETALRHVASKYPYDDYQGAVQSLRANAEEVAAELAAELQHRLSLAGVEVMEARLTHLAYSTEIASAMLQRQQADAIIAARQKIVEGAVGMVQMALAQLQREGIVELDEERKAAMINNLMVAIVSDRAASPVINTGSLY